MDVIVFEDGCEYGCGYGCVWLCMGECDYLLCLCMGVTMCIGGCLCM